jgi:hypothetical protein
MEYQMTETPVTNTAPVASTGTLSTGIGVTVSADFHTAIAKFEAVMASFERRAGADIQAVAADLRAAWADVRAHL